MISEVNVLKLKLGLWSSLLKNKITEHFPTLEKIQQQVKQKEFHPNKFCDHLNKLEKELES